MTDHDIRHPMTLRRGVNANHFLYVLYNLPFQCMTDMTDSRAI